MKNIFTFAIVLQFIFAMIFIDHRFFKPLGSDVMFGVLIVSLVVSIFMFWQIFKVKNIIGSHKIAGLFFASLPLIWLLILLKFIL
jgi:hypothetical protein